MRIGLLPKLFQSTRVRIGLPIAAAFAWVGKVSDGFTYWEWLSTHWSWVVNWVRSPYFYWAFAVCILALIASGLRSVAKAEVANGERDAAAETIRQQALIEVQERIASENRGAMRLPMKMAKAALFERELVVFADVIQRVGAMVERYKAEADEWLGDEEKVVASVTGGPPRPEMIFLVTWDVPFMLLQPMRFDVEWEPVALDFSHEGPGLYRRYKPNTPQSMIGRGALLKNISKARAKAEEMRQYWEAEKGKLQQFQREIDIGLRTYD